MGNKYVISITSFCVILFITFVFIGNVFMEKASADETTVAAAPSAAAENDEPSYPPTNPPNSDASNNTSDVATTTSVPDANVATATPAPAVNDNSSDANVVNISNRKTPVSIKVYSDIITESADTYNYRNPANNTNNSTPTPDNNDSNNVVDNSTTAPEDVTVTIPDNEVPVVSEPVTINKRILIGDSRTVHMKLAVNSSTDVWSCKSAMGLSWLKSTGVPNIESQITSNTAVIILMGVNDLFNADKYIEYLNKKAIEWKQKGAITYFVSVNPINEAKYKGFKNTKIEAFNEKMKTNLTNIKYIDTYSYLTSHSYTTTSDGLHYQNSTSKDIYNYIINNLN